MEIQLMEIQTALNKARHYCNYQERSLKEVKIKLQELEMDEDQSESIIKELEQENLLNEIRFAKAYVGGKFRLKHWGRIKITQGLIRKGISEQMISEALKEIDDDEYGVKLRRILEKKSTMLTGLESEVKKSNLARFALSQGYEPGLIWQFLDHKTI